MNYIKEVGSFFSLGIDGVSVDDRLKQFLKNTYPACVVLFKRNIESPEQAADLINQIKNVLKDRPPLISIDFEGGRVNRLNEHVLDMPSPRQVATKKDTGLSYRFGELSAKLLSILGIDVNYAPVADYYSESTNNAIGDRAFSSDISEVSMWIKGYLEGLSSGGVIGCIKHFPGLGASNIDSHIELPVDNRELDELYSKDMSPYKQSYNFPHFVMISHCSYPQVTGNDIPASLHPDIYKLLRKDVGFEGIALTDDLIMGALKNQGDLNQRCKEALYAGADGVLICEGMEEAEEVVVKFRERYKADKDAECKLNEIYRKYDNYRKIIGKRDNTKFQKGEFVQAVEKMKIFYDYVTGESASC